jgi:hypothetical protein
MPRRHLALLLVSLGLGLLACAIGERGDAPPQGWWAERGPVVPHDSFPADCSLCHEGDGWQSIRADFAFDHAAETGYELVGAHAAAECLRCHNDRGPVEVFAQRGCAGCHEDVHRGQLGKDCASCHEEASVDWGVKEAIALHDRTRFPLVGAHAAAACWRCHVGAQVGNFTRVDVECLTCHREDLARADEPDHRAAGFVDRCDRCHIPTSWTGAAFNHPGFPLTGAHRPLDCSECHTGGVFTGTPSDCFACHMDDYQGARDPDHVANNFPTDCERCHDTSSWEGALFDHGGIASGCVECHLDDYQATTDPNHVAAGFPTTCEACHFSTRTWQGARFDHAFPITSGEHAGFSCQTCHLVPGDFNAFSCTHCHDHSQREMDDEHDDVPGYVWESNACFLCHPDGRE